jgi:hypothetical protein
MKKIYVALILSLLIYSCKKSGTLPNGNGCISQVKGQYSSIKPSDSLVAVHLFQQNKIDFSSLHFTGAILNDTIKNIDGTHIYQHIFTVQNFNGLYILSDNVNFHFRDGIYQNTSGKLYTSVNLDNHPRLSLSKLRALYMSETVDKQGFNPTYRDSCVTAQLGYFDIGGNATTNIVKAWEVRLKTYGYPMAVFRDDNGQLLNFDSGIETLN